MGKFRKNNRRTRKRGGAQANNPLMTMINGFKSAIDDLNTPIRKGDSQKKATIKKNRIIVLTSNLNSLYTIIDDTNNNLKKLQASAAEFLEMQGDDIENKYQEVRELAKATYKDVELLVAMDDVIDKIYNFKSIEIVKQGETNLNTIINDTEISVDTSVDTSVLKSAKDILNIAKKVAYAPVETVDKNVDEAKTLLLEKAKLDVIMIIFTISNLKNNETLDTLKTQLEKKNSYLEYGIEKLTEISDKNNVNKLIISAKIVLDKAKIVANELINNMVKVANEQNILDVLSGGGKRRKTRRRRRNQKKKEKKPHHKKKERAAEKKHY